MFPEYEKALYIDSDTVVLGDISELFDYDIGDNYVGASCDPVVSQADIFGNYAEQVLDIDRNHYFNAGVLVLNINSSESRIYSDSLLNCFMHIHLLLHRTRIILILSVKIMFIG